MKTEIIVRVNDCITDSYLQDLSNRILELDYLIECVSSHREREPKLTKSGVR